MRAGRECFIEWQKKSKMAAMERMIVYNVMFLNLFISCNYIYDCFRDFSIFGCASYHILHT